MIEFGGIAHQLPFHRLLGCSVFIKSFDKFSCLYGFIDSICNFTHSGYKVVYTLMKSLFNRNIHDNTLSALIWTHFSGPDKWVDSF